MGLKRCVVGFLVGSLCSFLFLSLYSSCICKTTGFFGFVTLSMCPPLSYWRDWWILPSPSFRRMIWGYTRAGNPATRSIVGGWFHELAISIDGLEAWVVFICGEETVRVRLWRGKCVIHVFFVCFVEECGCSSILCERDGNAVCGVCTLEMRIYKLSFPQASL